MDLVLSLKQYVYFYHEEVQLALSIRTIKTDHGKKLQNS